MVTYAFNTRGITRALPTQAVLHGLHVKSVKKENRKQATFWRQVTVIIMLVHWKHYRRYWDNIVVCCVHCCHLNLLSVTNAYCHASNLCFFLVTHKVYQWRLSRSEVSFFQAITQDKQDLRNMYECPVYKTRTRGPTYVWTFNLKTKDKPAKWTLAGVALLLQV